MRLSVRRLPTEAAAVTRRDIAIAVRLLLAALVLGPAASFSAQESLREPSEAYRSFLDALETASALDDVRPHFSASRREQLGAMPVERAPELLQRLRSQASEAPPGWTIAHGAVSGNRAVLVLRGERVDGQLRTRLGSEVTLLREDGGWTVDRHGPWERVEVLPVSWRAGSAVPPGPGARRRTAHAFDPARARLVAQTTGSGEPWHGALSVDPRGRFLALTEPGTASVRLLELPGLRELWSAEVPHARGTFSLRPDGRGLVIVGEPTWTPQALPLALNLEQRPPDGGYYFSSPILVEAAAAIEGRPTWRALAFHPAQPILAMGLGDEENERAGAIVLQPTGDGLWTTSRPEAPTVWRTDATPGSLSWSPGGERLAWTTTNQEVGAPIYVARYPGNGEARAFSRPDFAPFGPIAFGPAGRLLAAAGELAGGMAVVVWDTDAGKEIASLPGIARFAFAPDGDHLFAVREGGPMADPEASGEILVWKLGASAPAHTIAAFQSAEPQAPDDVAALATSPNGRFLIAVSRAGVVDVWDLDGGT